jgi:hypothetical protein
LRIQLRVSMLSLAAVCILGAGISSAVEPERFVDTQKLPSGQTVVVAEGDFEARSIGSFSIRLYDAAPAGDATTFFRNGDVRVRDGTIQKVVLADVQGDDRPEIIVIVRSVGTGSYLSVHAYSYDDSGLAYRASLESLAPDADPVASLRNHLR